MRKHISQFLIFIVVLFGTQPLHAQFGWEWQNPLPQGNWLKSVQMIDTSVAVAVGWMGTIIRTTDGGVHWTRQQPFLQSHMIGVSFTDRLTGTIVGGQGTIIRTENGGVTWTKQKHPSETETLMAVNFTSYVTGTAVGSNGLVLRTTNSGETWTIQPTGVDETLRAISFIDFATGVVVGEQGSVLFTNNGGATWTKQFTGHSTPLFGVAIAGADTIVAVGDSGMILRSVNAGVTWAQQQCFSNVMLTAVTLVNGQVGTIVARDGSVFSTTDGGGNWILQTHNPNSDLWGVSFANSSIGMIVGNRGIIRKTTNGGIAWMNQSSGPIVRMRSVSYLNSTTGFVVGDSNVLMHTTNGGLNWIEKTNLGLQSLTSVCYVDSLNAWIVGNPTMISRTSDAGNSWIRQLSVDSGSIEGVAFANTNCGIAVGSLGTIFITSDGGAHWTRSAGIDGHPIPLNYTFGSVAMIDSLTAITAGTVLEGLVLLRSTDGGRNWISDRSAPSTWAPESYSSISFINRDVGLVGTDNDVFRTTDGGVNWSRCSGSFQCTGISMVDLRHAFAIDNGRYPASIFKTTDFGITWTVLSTPRSVDSYYGISTEDRFKITVVGTGGAILHTSTGGIYTPLSVSIDEHDFGNVPVSTTMSVNASIKNTSSQTVTVTPLLTGSSAFTSSADTIVLAPGASQSLTLHFNPVVPGHQGTLVTLRHDGIAVDTDLIGLEGVGVGPQSLLSRSSLDLGDILRDSTKTDSILIFNTGNAPMTVNGVSTNDPHIEIRLSTSTIAAGDTAIMRIEYTPNSIGSFTDSVRIEYATPAQSQVLVYHGRCVVNDFVVQSHSLDFGNVHVDSTRSVSIGVVNPTNLASSIDSISSNDPHFAAPPSLALGPLDAIAVSIAFTPDTLGFFSGWVVLYHNYNTPPDSVFVHGNGTLQTGVFDPAGHSPQHPFLLGAFPNPIEPTGSPASIAFSLPMRGDITLNVYSPIGELVATVARGAFSAGTHVVKFDPSMLPAGIYLYRLFANGITESKQIIVVR